MPIRRRRTVRRRRPVARRVTRRRVTRVPRKLPNAKVYCKLHTTIDAISPITAGTPFLADYWCMFQLLNPQNGITDVNGTSHLAPENWLQYSSLYQLYKVHGIAVRFIPFFNTASSTDTVFYRPMYTAVDYVSSYNDVMTLDNMMGHNNLKIYNALRPIKTYTRVPIYSANPNAEKTSSQAVLNKGWYSTDFTVDLPPSHGYQLWRMSIATAEARNAVLGKFLVTYYIEFNGVR